MACARALLLLVVVLACCSSAFAQRCKGGKGGSFVELSAVQAPAAQPAVGVGAAQPDCFHCVPVCWIDATTKSQMCNLVDTDASGKVDPSLCANAAPGSIRPSGAVTMHCAQGQQFGTSAASQEAKVIEKKIALQNLVQAAKVRGKPGVTADSLAKLASWDVSTNFGWTTAVAFAQSLGASVEEQPLDAGDHYLLCAQLTPSAASQDLWCWETPPTDATIQYSTAATSLAATARQPQAGGLAPPRFAEAAPKLRTKVAAGVQPVAPAQAPPSSGVRRTKKCIRVVSKSGHIKSRCGYLVKALDHPVGKAIAKRTTTRKQAANKKPAINNKPTVNKKPAVNKPAHNGPANKRGRTL